MNLFADMARFRAWLKELPEEAPAGYRGDALMCPVARWLSEELLGLPVSVTEEWVRVGAGELGYSESLPAVLCYFVEQIDGMSRYGGRVTPSEAIYALDLAERRAAQLLIPAESSASTCVYRDGYGLCGRASVSPILHAFVRAGDAASLECRQIHGRLCDIHCNRVVCGVPDSWYTHRIAYLENPLYEPDTTAWRGVQRGISPPHQPRLVDAFARDLEEVV